MNPGWEPPGGPTRAAAGLLGVAGGETWRDNGVRGDGPVTSALIDLCHSYVARRGQGVPDEVARRHDGVAGPGWLLAVALVRPDDDERVADTLQLALAAGVGLHALGDCVAYVELAAALFAGKPVEVPVPGERPELCGESAADAVRAGLWALGQSEVGADVAHVVRALSEVAPPGVGAAAAGLVGLKGGGRSVPAHWHRRLHCAAACRALAPGLVRVRARGDDGTDRTPASGRTERTGQAPSAPVTVRARSLSTPFLPSPRVTDFLRRPLVGTGVVR